jgi:hypothetical protein
VEVYDSGDTHAIMVKLNGPEGATMVVCDSDVHGASVFEKKSNVRGFYLVNMFYSTKPPRPKKRAN